MIVELISRMGLSGQLATAASIAIVAWYVYRASGLFAAVASLMSSVVSIVLAVLVFVAVGTAAGWIAPGVMVADLASWAGLLVERVFERLVDLIGEQLIEGS